ncbi:unnamed protein product (macronuclear) [Paramecium tetraurelia]|uniref:Uncharacterized protein n=1 Tax=Paramecium tetraurelia TaxID=5888 RepID=A0EIM6_PARTE|nr:uncharacterized protein GSPATT00027496001 [Paramecium tetraurelia]CAK95167.1 unnamed protein product [Paramecium tetraurelia]|eukprot:XP_001462540.1 hypothetical protein (macronuclear) [Paramecium tetraurelia strain d4-2]
MIHYKKRLVVQNDIDHILLPQICDYRSLSINKETIIHPESKERKQDQRQVAILQFSFINSKDNNSDRFHSKPQHMMNIERKKKMLNIQLMRVCDSNSLVSHHCKHYKTFQEINFIKYKKIA